LEIGRRGDADVVLVHAKPLEEKFMAESQGVKRYDVMYNDFVLIGPKTDPARVAGTKDVAAAFRKIKEANAPFVSRGDRSGTHFAELEIWKLAGIDIVKEKGPWYRDTGQGMAPALNTASAMNAYILVGRGARHAHVVPARLAAGRSAEPRFSRARRDDCHRRHPRRRRARDAVRRAAGKALPRLGEQSLGCDRLGPEALRAAAQAALAVM